MKITLNFLLILAMAASINSLSSAALIIGAAPTTDLLVNDIAGATNSNILDEDVNANHGRADSFTLGTSSSGTFDITSVTLAKNGNQTFNGDNITVFIATGGPTEWDLGTGHDTATDGTDYLVDTGMTLQVQEIFPITGLVTAADFLTFEFTSPVTVADNTQYTVGWIYNQGSGVDRIGYDENTTGGRLSVTTTAYGGASSRGISFSVQGVETVPEPGSALLSGLGLLALLLYRRRR